VNRGHCVPLAAVLAAVLLSGCGGSTPDRPGALEPVSESLPPGASWQAGADQKPSRSVLAPEDPARTALPGDEKPGDEGPGDEGPGKSMPRTGLPPWNGRSGSGDRVDDRVPARTWQPPETPSGRSGMQETPARQAPANPPAEPATSATQAPPEPSIKPKKRAKKPKKPKKPPSTPAATEPAVPADPGPAATPATPAEGTAARTESTAHPGCGGVGCR
jgi:hypothetical protein